MSRLVAGSILPVVVLGVAAPPVSAQCDASWIRPILPSGSPVTYVDDLAISTDGRVVVGTAFFDGRREAFRWDSASGLTLLGDLDGDPAESSARAVASGGVRIVGYAGPGATTVPIQVVPGEPMQNLGDLLGLAGSGVAMGVSSDGSVIVGYQHASPNPDSGWRWSAVDGLQLIDENQNFQGVYPLSVSGDGAAIVGYGWTGSTVIAFRWTASAGAVALQNSDGRSLASVARACSRDGGIVVGERRTEALGESACRWSSAGEVQSLLDFNGTESDSQAFGISADGTLTVGHIQGAAAVWPGAGSAIPLAEYLLTESNLDVSGWYLNSAQAVSGDARYIVGQGTPPGGGLRGFVAFVAPPRGDLNCDDVVDFFDIDGFLVALFTPSQYAARFPSCCLMLGDLNADGFVDFFDVDPFLHALFGI